MKALINTAMIKEQLKRFLPISLISFLAYIGILICIWNEKHSDGTYSYYSVAVRIFEQRSIIMEFILVVSAFVVVLVSFLYNFSPKSAGTVHSYPVTKKQIFLSNVVSGYILFLIPLFIFCMLLSYPKILVNERYLEFNAVQYQLNGIMAIVQLFLRSILIFSFYFSVFLLASVLAGNAIYYFILSVALPLLHLGFHLLLMYIKQLYIFGSPINLRYTQGYILNTNAVFLGLFRNEPHYFITIIIYIAIAVVLFVLSAYLYGRRKLERSGDSLVFKPAKCAFVCLASIAGMFLNGALFYGIFFRWPMIYIGYAIGFVVAYFISQMMVEKNLSLFVKKKEFKFYLAGGVSVLAVILFVGITDITGYVRYVPNEYEIEGVLFDHYYNDHTKDFAITDEEIIGLTVEAHEELINDNFYTYNVISGNGNFTNSRGVSINYVLKNGYIVSRNYNIDIENYKNSKAKELYKREEVIFQRYRWIDDPNSAKEIEVRYYDNERDRNLNFTITDPEEIESILVAVKEDYMENERAFIDNLNTSYKGTFDIRLWAKLDDKYENDNSNFYLSNSERTNAWLLEHGYLDELD